MLDIDLFLSSSDKRCKLFGEICAVILSIFIKFVKNSLSFFSSFVLDTVNFILDLVATLGFLFDVE